MSSFSPGSQRVMPVFAERPILDGLWPLVSWALVVAFFLVRPMHLGWGYAPMGALLLLGIGALVMLEGINLRTFSVVLLPLGLFIVFRFYLTLHAYFNHAGSIVPLQGTFLIIATLVGFAFIAGKPGLLTSAVRKFVIFLALQGFSFSITMLLAMVSDLQSIYLFQIKNDLWEIGGSVYFPFTIGYSYLEYSLFTIPRLSAGFRESGLAPAFYVWCLFILPYLALDRWWIRIGLFIGLFATQSTLVFLVLTIPLIVFYAFKAEGFAVRLFGGLAAVIFAVLQIYLMYTVPEFGLHNKLNSESWLHRMDAMQASLDVVAVNPWGQGVLASTFSDHANINLIASIGTIGLPGILLALFVFLAAVVTDRARVIRFVLVVPFLLTWLASQSFLEAPLVFMIVSLSPFVFLEGRRIEPAAVPPPAARAG